MKNRFEQISFIWFLLFIISTIVGSASGGHYSLFIIPTFADVETDSTNYKIKTPTLDEAGESKSSINYKLGDSVAQTVQGETTSTNYKVYAGFQYYGEALLVLSISCDPTVNIPPVTPGTPQSANNSCTITTNSTSGYTLYTWEGSDLTRTSPPAQTISAANLGSYSGPVPWSDGVSVGLGFSLSGPTTEVKWATGSNFASFVTQSAAANTYSSSLSEGSTSLVSFLKLDTTTAQLTGAYQNEIYYYVTGSIL